MATHENGTSSEVSAEMVGHAFVSQFYTILHERPEMVHKFFQDSSTMSRPGPDGTLMTVSTMKGINDLILSCNCQNYKAEILTADAQASHMNGVIVLVTGCLTGQDNAIRKFTESFFLAPQNHGYFVLNSAFRFVEYDTLAKVTPVEEENDAKASPASVALVQETAKVPENSVENHNTEAEVSIENNKVLSDASENQPKAPAVETDIPQVPVESTHVAQPVVEASSNGRVDPSKKSYASLLRGLKNGASATMVHTPTSAAKATGTNAAQISVSSPTGQQARVETVLATAPESAAPNGSLSSTDQSEAEGYSIYIGDLPWNATIELVEQEFKKFGNIKRNGIQVRSNKGFCFGFVEYEDASAKQRAIEMGTIRIGGKEAFIQEKKTSTRVVNGVNMHVSGRGGFRNDGSYRGRGNYSNGRGYVRNNYNRRNMEGPTRGNVRNGDGYQTVYQNGRGRSSHQGANPN